MDSRRHVEVVSVSSTGSNWFCGRKRKSKSSSHSAGPPTSHLASPSASSERFETRLPSLAAPDGKLMPSASDSGSFNTLPIDGKNGMPQSRESEAGKPEFEQLHGTDDSLSSSPPHSHAHSRQERRNSMRDSLTSMLEVTDEEVDMLRGYSATRIQAQFRGYRARKKLRESVDLTYEAPNRGFSMRRKSAIRRDQLPLAKFAPGRVLEWPEVERQYDILDTMLGTGEFAEVFKCQDVIANKQLAAKVIPKSKVLYPPERDLMLNEIRILREIHHDNCVLLYDVLETSDKVYLFLEFLEGGDLFDRLEAKGAFSESDARDIVRDTLSALSYLHTRRIVHRDIKPENLMFTDVKGKQTVKLTDFGLAAVVQLPLHDVCGSPTYMAPEIATRCPEGYTMAVDIWSLGVVTVVLLCGFPPYNPPSLENLSTDYYGPLDFETAEWDGISDGARNFVRACLRVATHHRMRAVHGHRHPWLQRQTQPQLSDTDRMDMLKDRLRNTRRMSQQTMSPAPQPGEEARRIMSPVDPSTFSLLSQLNISCGFGTLLDMQVAEETSQEDLASI